MIKFLVGISILIVVYFWFEKNNIELPYSNKEVIPYNESLNENDDILDEDNYTEIVDTSFTDSSSKSDSKSIKTTSSKSITNTHRNINRVFKCDGREYCSQMTSCEEAKFFLANCPNVKMDGDNDGIPCERQWCKRFF